MRARDTSPHYSNLGSMNGTFSFEYISNSLAQVEVAVFLGLDTFNAQQNLVSLLVALRALVAENAGLRVESKTRVENARFNK
jgi:hypothetical protein